MVGRRILVTEGEQRAALALTRSLGRAGGSVFVCAARTPSLSGVSRWSRGEVRVPDALGDPDGYVAALAALVQRWGVDTLIPTTEAGLLAVLPVRDSFPGVCIPFPDASAFRSLSDKHALLRAASALGIPVPAQEVVLAPGDPTPREAPFPVVVKPARSVGEGARRLKLSVSHARDEAELAARVREYPAAAYPLLVQQRIHGAGVGIFLLRWNGETRAVFAHRRIREKPPSGGVSVYCESVAPDAALVRGAEALLERFDWRGVAMVEFKEDSATGVSYLMEVNGRFWGSLQLAIDAGVDFPVLLLAAAAGLPARSSADYRIGVRSRWWLGDLDHLIARFRKSEAQLSLPPESPTRLQALGSFLTAGGPNDRTDTVRWDDPRPFLREMIQWLRRE